jgi:hypothetical protein
MHLFDYVPTVLIFTLIVVIIVFIARYVPNGRNYRYMKQTEKDKEHAGKAIESLTAAGTFSERTVKVRR